MTLGSYKVSSWSYIAPLVAAAMISFTSPKIVAPESIKPENIKSMQQKYTNTMTSYGYGKRSPHFTKEGVIEKTSNNLYITTYRDYERNGRGLGPDDYFHYGNWIQNKYPPSEWNRVELPRRTSASGATESFEERLLKLHPNDPQTPTYIHTFYLQDLRINEAGKKLSESENFKQKLTKHFGTKIAQALAEGTIKSGGYIEPISYIAVGFVPEDEDIAYAVGRAKFDDKIMIIAAEDIYGKISQIARTWGIDTESYLETMLAEEQEHINRRSFDKHGDNIAEEYATKDSIFHKYLELAKGAEGGDPRNPRYERERRRALIKATIKKADRDTTEERYSKKGSFYKKLYLENRAALEDALKEEAIEEGYRGDDVKDYVSSKMKAIGEESRDSRMSKLEKIAESDKEADSKEASAGKPTAEAA